MKFSILVPVYNVEEYLEQCVDSLLNQTYKGDYEIVLVDDGSTDSSGQICDKYAENHPEKVKVVHKENGGHTSARLEAIKNASGEYSLFCDSDDFVEPNLLETVDNVLSDNPDTDMVMYSFCYYEDGKKTQRNISVWNGTEIFEGDSKKKLYNLLITTPYINSLWTKAIKTEFLKNDPTDYSVLKDKDVAEDAYIVSYFVTACKKIININEPLYNYRINRQSISRSYNFQKIARKNTLFLYYRLKSLLPIWGMDTEEHHQKLNACRLNEVVYTFRQYYENAENAKNRKEILNFDWDSMLPEEVINSTNNPYENAVNRKVLSYIHNKNKIALQIYSLKNRIYKKFKTIRIHLRNLVGVIVINKKNIKLITEKERILYLGKTKASQKQMKKTGHKRYFIYMYIYCLRFCQFYRDIRNDKNSSRFKKIVSKYKFKYYNRKKNIFSYKSGVEIGLNSKIGLCCDIWHGGVVINGNIGDYCVLHGNNIIGNKGVGRENLCPTIGNNVDIGAGAVIIGDITLADNCIVGAGAVVTKNFTKSDSIIIGVPGKQLKKEHN